MSKHLEETLREKIAQVEKGGDAKYHEKLKEQNKLFVRDRLKLLFDGEFTVEDGLFANVMAGDLPADGVVTAIGKVRGQTVCVMANDSTVKAGSWGSRTVEKIIRIQETAEKMRVPLIYLVDSAGARITDQLEMFPGRRGAGRIFYNEVKLSGKIYRKSAFLFWSIRSRRCFTFPAFLRYCHHGRQKRQHVLRLSAHG